MTPNELIAIIMVVMIFLVASTVLLIGIGMATGNEGTLKTIVGMVFVIIGILVMWKIIPKLFGIQKVISVNTAP
jgi:CBS domain containing-hemolysin-like protein